MIAPSGRLINQSILPPPPASPKGRVCFLSSCWLAGPKLRELGGASRWPGGEEAETKEELAFQFNWPVELGRENSVSGELMRRLKAGPFFFHPPKPEAAF